MRNLDIVVLIVNMPNYPRQQWRNTPRPRLCLFPYRYFVKFLPMRMFSPVFSASFVLTADITSFTVAIKSVITVRGVACCASLNTALQKRQVRQRHPARD